MTNEYPSPPDWRGLCEELLAALENEGHAHWPGGPDGDPLIEQVRAALSQPEPEVVGPTDEELMEAFDGEFAEFFDSSDGFGTTAIPRSEWIKVARAVLSRYGLPAPAPAEEVAELVQELRNVVTAYKSCHNQDSIWSLLGGDVNARLTVTLLTRSADLLEQRQGVPVPVAVSERLPGVRDCAPWPGEPDASAWCWVGSDVDGGWSWEQRSAGCLAAFPDDFTHWLPAHALPLPSGEVAA